MQTKFARPMFSHLITATSMKIAESCYDKTVFATASRYDHNSTILRQMAQGSDGRIGWHGNTIVELFQQDRSKQFSNGNPARFIYTNVIHASHVWLVGK